MTGQEARDDEREALAQVIANAFFAMQAGQEWNAEGASYSQPVPSGGDMDLAVSILAAGYRKHPEPEITDEMVADALDARAAMSRSHCYLYATEKCRCGAEWSDAHWMRYLLEAALQVSVGERNH